MPFDPTSPLFWIGLIILCGFLAVVGLLAAMALFKSFYRKVEQGRALIINRMGDDNVHVTFSGGWVYPVIHKAETMDISVKAMEIDRRAHEGLICRDNIRADIKVTFFVRVNKTEEDVLKVAQAIGCARASTLDTLEELFNAKFSEALKTVGKQMDFVDLYQEREQFKERIIAVIGTDLNGYSLEDVAIDYLEQTPKDSLDPDNILDAQGIRKITELTSREAVTTNEFNRNRERDIKDKDVKTRQQVLELQRQEEEAEAVQRRQVETIRASEEASTEEVRAQQRLKAEHANIKTEEQLSVAQENKQRQIEIAIKNKERTVAVEHERVERDRQLEQVERERLVELKTIDKEKSVEVEKKNIQEVIRERVAVEKTVAEEEEKIKDTRVLSEAERVRKAEVIDAEREGEQAKIRVTKAAEAKEVAAKHQYQEQVTLAEAEEVKAQKVANAKKAMAEGLIAEEAAGGLARVKVQEAEANAIEVTGKAEASAAEAKYTAEAKGIETRGTAEAKTMELRFTAEATGTEAKGRAEASATQARFHAEASGIEAKGKAEATAMGAKYDAEAEGIDKKADAMKKYDAVGKEHEEFKLRLGMQERVQLAAIDVNRQIAEAQAMVLGEAMKTAKIDIVGGGDDFVERFMKAIAVGKSIDGFVAKSEVAQSVGKMLTDSEGHPALGRVKELIDKVGIDTEDIKNLTVSALLTKLASQAGDAATKKEAMGLKNTLDDLGLGDLMALFAAK